MKSNLYKANFAWENCVLYEAMRSIFRARFLHIKQQQQIEFSWIKTFRLKSWEKQSPCSMYHKVCTRKTIHQFCSHSFIGIQLFALTFAFNAWLFVACVCRSFESFSDFEWKLVEQICIYISWFMISVFFSFVTVENKKNTHYSTFYVVCWCRTSLSIDGKKWTSILLLCDGKSFEDGGNKCRSSREIPASSESEGNILRDKNVWNIKPFLSYLNTILSCSLSSPFFPRFLLCHCRENIFFLMALFQNMAQKPTNKL